MLSCVAARAVASSLLDFRRRWCNPMKWTGSQVLLISATPFCKTKKNTECIVDRPGLNKGWPKLAWSEKTRLRRDRDQPKWGLA